MTRPASATNRTGVVVLTADSGVRAVAARDIQRQRADRPAGDRGHRRRRRRRVRSPKARPSSSSISTPAAKTEMQALERLMARIGAWPPVVVVTQSFDAEVARRLLQMRVADFLVKPVQPVELVRTCARVRAADREPRPRKRRSTRSCPRSAAPASPRSRSRPRCCCSTAAQRGTRQHLPGRSRFPARRLRRLSRSRAAARPQGDRAAAGAARPPAPGDHAVAAMPRGWR